MTSPILRNTRDGADDRPVMRVETYARGGIPSPTTASSGDHPLRLRSSRTEPARPVDDAATPAAVGVAEEPSPFGKMVRALGREVDRGESLVKRALAPGAAEMGPGDLLALQAGIYRYSEAVDLSAKLVDRATSGLRTVLQGQQ